MANEEDAQATRLVQLHTNSAAAAEPHRAGAAGPGARHPVAGIAQAPMRGPMALRCPVVITICGGAGAGCSGGTPPFVVELAVPCSIADHSR